MFRGWLDALRTTDCFLVCHCVDAFDFSLTLASAAPVTALEGKTENKLYEEKKLSSDDFGN